MPRRKFAKPAKAVSRPISCFPVNDVEIYPGGEFTHSVLSAFDSVLVSSSLAASEVEIAIPRTTNSQSGAVPVTEAHRSTNKKNSGH